MRVCMCARRLTRPSSMTMPSASVRASGLLLWSFPRRLALLPCRHLDRLGPRCSGHPSQPSALAAVTRRRAVAPGRRVGQPGVSLADCRITDPRVNKCREADAISPVRDHPACGTSGWRRAGAPRLLAGHAMARAALPGIPGALDVPPRGRPDTNAECRSSQGPCASSVTPNPDTPMVAYGWWYARTGIIWSSSGRTRPVPFAPAVGLPALSSVCSPQRAARRRGSSPWRAGTASAPVPGPTPTAVPVLETGIEPRLVITSWSMSTSTIAYAPRRAVFQSGR